MLAIVLDSSCKLKSVNVWVSMFDICRSNFIQWAIPFINHKQELTNIFFVEKELITLGKIKKKSISQLWNSTFLNKYHWKIMWKCFYFPSSSSNFNYFFVKTLENVRSVPPLRSSSIPPPVWKKNEIALCYSMISFHIFDVIVLLTS